MRRTAESASSSRWRAGAWWCRTTRLPASSTSARAAARNSNSSSAGSAPVHGGAGRAADHRGAL
ncbi:MAG: hypothetical protein MZU95_10590 [Desulfomicrobium escambiense]|nr:hypothetical protein [Desulfomicrobium escambiense]